MNEFIVWDKNDERFLDSLFVNSELNEAVSSNEDFGIFQYIGKTDTEGNKIYADCSIVELDYYYGMSGHVKEKGYFTYNNETLGYSIQLLNKSEKLTSFTGLAHKIDNLKIIGTIQENKLGLIK